MAATPSLSTIPITKPATLPRRRQRITGWARFGLVIVLIIGVIISFVAGFGCLLGLVFFIVSFFDTQSEPPKLMDALVGIAFFAVTAGIIALTAWLFDRLNVGERRGKDRANPFVCKLCFVEAPTIEARLIRHVGMIYASKHDWVEGHFCKDCFRKTFWPYTLTTFFFGWWAIPSCAIAPLALVANTVAFGRSIGLRSKPAGAVPPTLDAAGVQKLKPYAREIEERIKRGDLEDHVTLDIAEATRLTPGQTYLFVRPIADAATTTPR